MIAESSLATAPSLACRIQLDIRFVVLEPFNVLQVLDKLEDKRTQVERELAKIPGAPSNRDVFQLCRGFERAFTYTIEVAFLLIPAREGDNIYVKLTTYL